MSAPPEELPPMAVLLLEVPPVSAPPLDEPLEEPPPMAVLLLGVPPEAVSPLDVRANQPATMRGMDGDANLTLQQLGGELQQSHNIEHFEFPLAPSARRGETGDGKPTWRVFISELTEQLISPIVAAVQREDLCASTLLPV